MGTHAAPVEQSAPARITERTLNYREKRKKKKLITVVRAADLLLDGHLSGHLLGSYSRLLHRHAGLEGHCGRGVSASLWGLHGAYIGVKKSAAFNYI